MPITIQTKAGSHAVECDDGENILFAALKHGLNVPYECATGTCGTCRCRMMEGQAELQWKDAPGLSYVKQEKNETLMCQALAQGDPVIRVPGNITKTDARIGHFGGQLEGLKKLTGDVVRFSVTLDRPMDFMAGQFVRWQPCFRSTKV